MIDIVSVIVDFRSNLDEFDFVYNVLNSSLSSLNIFIDENVKYICVNSNNIVIKVYVFDSVFGDYTSIEKFYIHEVKNVNDLLDKLGSSLDRMRDLDSWWSDKINSSESYDECVSDFYKRWDNYNKISYQHKIIVRNKHIALF